MADAYFMLLFISVYVLNLGTRRNATTCYRNCIALNYLQRGTLEILKYLRSRIQTGK